MYTHTGTNAGIVHETGTWIMRGKKSSNERKKVAEYKRHGHEKRTFVVGGLHG